MDVVAGGEPAGRGAVAAADVGEVLAGLEGEGCGEFLKEVDGGLLGAARIVLPVPESMVQVLAPEGPVAFVELVVVTGDVAGSSLVSGGNHGVSLGRIRGPGEGDDH